MKLKSKFVAAIALAGAAVSGVASAAIDPSVATALAAVQSDATAVSGIVTPIVIAVLGLGITISLIKRFAKKI